MGRDETRLAKGPLSKVPHGKTFVRGVVCGPRGLIRDPRDLIRDTGDTDMFVDNHIGVWSGWGDPEDPEKKQRLVRF